MKFRILYNHGTLQIGVTTTGLLMESIFHLGGGERPAFLRHMMQSLGSTYICLWSYSPLPSNCLLFLDGFYKDDRIDEQPSSSSGTLSARLFNAYCGSVFDIDNGCVPGFAFWNKVAYLEMKTDQLQTMASNQVQLQFYQEAGIKVGPLTTVFMSCAAGEIELGFSTDHHVMNDLQMQIQSWFSTGMLLPHPTASSSLNHSHSLFDIIPNSAFITDPSTLQQSSQIPEMESEMTSSAFKSYNPSAAALAPVLGARNHKPTSFKRALMFFRNLPTHQLQIQQNHTTANQMHHMIAERRRREKHNKIFQTLRSLLPQDANSKKDKVSVLRNTTVYLSSLRSQMEELQRRNATLETQLSTAQRETSREELGRAPSTQRVNVEIARISPSTSEAVIFLDLRISLRSQECKLSDLVARVLRFLKLTINVSLLSLQSSTRLVESTPIHSLVMRLKAEGDEFDETGFQEAVRRVVDGLPH